MTIPRFIFAQKETVWVAQTTTNAYADLGVAWAKKGFKTTSVVIMNTGLANGAKVKVLGSTDGVNFTTEIQAEAIIAAAGSLTVNFTTYYTHIKIQILDQNAGDHTTVSASACAIAI